MKLFIAGATGVMGRVLVPQLINEGHDITALTRNPDKAQWLQNLGVNVVGGDIYDVDHITELMKQAQPETVIHQLTALPKAIDPNQIEDHLAANDRIRVEGTRNLVEASVKAGVKHIVAQSISFILAPEGSRVKDETAPLWLDAPWPIRRTIEASHSLETQVLNAPGIKGIALRYGYFYGPGSAYDANGSMANSVRAGYFPIGGNGTGIFSFIHIDDAASATVAALDTNIPSGIYNIVDDEPAAQKDWLPVYAQALGAPEPQHMSAEGVLEAVGDYGLHMMTEMRGASNAKAKTTLKWKPDHASWRTGFATTLNSAQVEVSQSVT